MAHKISRWFWRKINIICLVSFIISPVFSVNAQDQPPQPAPENAEYKGSIIKADQSPNKTPSVEDAFQKLDPFLQNLSKNSLTSSEKSINPSKIGQQAVIVNITGSFSPEILANLRPYFVDGKIAGVFDLASDIAGGSLSGLILPYNLIKVASFPEVKTIYNAEPVRMEYEMIPADDTRQAPAMIDWETLRANAENLRQGSLPWSEARVFGDGLLAISSPQAAEDWFDMSPMGPTKAEIAWDRGFMGQGVQVAIIDDGIDFAHPDLMGTQSIYNSRINSHLNGWPVVMDPFTLRAYFYDTYFGSTYTSGGFPGVTLMDTSATPKLNPCGTNIKCFLYTPRIAYNTPGTQNTYTIHSSMSLSCIVHVGTHHDESLRDYVWGEQVAILVTDPNSPGVYDTVYVDLDNDYDFQDEKPLTKANPADPATYNNMIAYRDLNSDGKADLNGGLLYFIADGVHYVPGTDWLFDFPTLGIQPPASGTLIGLHGPWDSGYSHGTQCASNVVGSGQIDGYLPEFQDIDPYPGTPAGAVYGAAPQSKLVAMNSSWGFTGNATYRDAYLLAAIGWDGITQTGLSFPGDEPEEDTDTIQITSNSYGFSAEFNDGWDNTSMVVDDIMRKYAPYLQFLFSTGNGGPGYGTAAPPSPGSGIAVGASTEYGSTGWDTITYTTQINYNDIAAFSNSGPGAREGAGVDILAGGAYAAGAEELNYYGKYYFNMLDGNLSWSTWGGTSRSSPTAAGVLALIYQAYKDRHSVWPTAKLAKSILMASATDVNHDAFKQGAGAVNADVGTALANGLYGVYTDEDSAAWTPGDYRGVDAQNFAHIVNPDSSWEKTFTLINDSATDHDVDLRTTFLELINQQEFTFTVTPQNVADESAYGDSNRDNFYRAFNYFIPLHGFGEDDMVTIPEDTELMIVRQIYDFNQFDVNFDYAYDNRFYLTLYNWLDYNLDGNVWEDKNLNGVVNFINDFSNLTGIDQAPQLDWDDARTELDRWEYARFGYNRPVGNTYELSVQDPLNRNFDGIFIGLRHIFTENATNITTNIKYRVEFYKHADVNWLETDIMTMTVPANGIAAFNAEANIPVDMPPGTYASTIEVISPADLGYSANNLIIPVTINVAAALSNLLEAPFDQSAPNSLTLGGLENYTFDQNTTYNNGALRGYFDWGWREDSGDWRNFYLDLQSASTTAPPYTAHVILRDQWEGPSPVTDIDSIILGPSEHPSNLWSAGIWNFNTYDPLIHGPYNLETVARSVDERSGRSVWRFNTSSGANEEWLFFPFEDGLHEILQHNVLFQGNQFDTIFTKTLGVLFEDVTAFNIDTYYNQGPIGDVNLISTLALNGLQTDAYLLSEDIENFIDEPLPYTGAGTLEWSYPFPVENAVSIELSINSINVPDLDLFLFYWNGSVWEQRGSSAGSASNEYIYLPDPQDGNWLVAIDNYSGPAGSFNLEKVVLVRSPGITATVNTSGAIPANTEVSIHVAYDAALSAGIHEGSLFIGPPEAPHLKEIPITINKLPMKLAWVEKTVDYDLHFPGDTVHYTLDLFNTFPSDPIVWELSDYIPDLTSYVGANITCNGTCGTVSYDPISDKLTFSGVLPTSLSGMFTGFENGGAWPDGWTRVHLGATTYQWTIRDTDPYNGTYHAFIKYDSTAASNEWLYSPEFAVTENDNQVSFYIQSSTLWPGATLKLHVFDSRGNLLNTIWDLMEDETWTTFEYRQKVLSLAAYAGQNIKLAWQYVGIDGESVYLDDISMPGVLPAASIDLQVMVEEDPLISGGETITNTASLTGKAVFPQEEQPLINSTDEVSMRIGQEDLSTSYKSAPSFVESSALIEYQIHLINSGEGVAALQLVDPIPSGTVYHSHEPSADLSFSFNEALLQMEWFGTLDPGEEIILVFQVTAPETSGVSILNDAFLSWNSGESHLIAQTQIGIGLRTYMPLIMK